MYASLLEDAMTCGRGGEEEEGLERGAWGGGGGGGRNGGIESLMD